MKAFNGNKLIKGLFFSLILLWFSNIGLAQSLTSSPYSRYGFGELNSQTFAAQSAMGNSFTAYQQDTIAPFFINVANPAGLSGIKQTVLELGAQSQFTKISNSNANINKINTNFSYGALAFPIKKIGGAAFGIMPYSTVGYKITSSQEEANVGTMKYIFEGNGGLSKAFLSSGIKPFRSQEYKFYNSKLADSLVKHNKTNTFKRIKFIKQLISNLSVGATANFIFGTINQTTDVIYPSSISYYNVKREHATQVNDFAINGGLQTHFMIDSIKHKGSRHLLKERIIIGSGFYLNSPANLKAKQSNIIYNYALDGFGAAKPKDTILNSQDINGNVTLPLEMGVGLSFKKGEKLTVLIDGATTNWKNYKNFDLLNSEFKNSYRISTGINYVPNKLAFGSSNYVKRIHYRIGASYTDGYLDLKNTKINNYSISAGLGLPVGIGRFDEIGMINISAQYGRLGTTANNLLQEEYVRLNIGFTFNKRWFIKYKYD